MDAQTALERLRQGNERFLTECTNGGDIGPDVRGELSRNGQRPFAVIVACSDSRVVPEHVFDCGLGELFCVRTAGNTIGASELASVVYACEHLGCSLVVVMGHTQCGAVAATLAGGTDGAVGTLTERITAAIGEERDPDAASAINAQAGATALASHPELVPLAENGLQIRAALHHIDTGVVEFL